MARKLRLEYPGAIYHVISQANGVRLLVTFSVVSGPATVAGNILTVTGAGLITVRAHQAGAQNGASGTYSPASLDREFTVVQGTPPAEPSAAFSVLSDTKRSGTRIFALSVSAPEPVWFDIDRDGYLEEIIPVGVGGFEVLASVDADYTQMVLDVAAMAATLDNMWRSGYWSPFWSDNFSADSPRAGADAGWVRVANISTLSLTTDYDIFFNLAYRFTPEPGQEYVIFGEYGHRWGDRVENWPADSLRVRRTYGSPDLEAGQAILSVQEGSPQSIEMLSVPYYVIRKGKPFAAATLSIGGKSVGIGISGSSVGSITLPLPAGGSASVNLGTGTGLITIGGSTISVGSGGVTINGAPPVVVTGEIIAGITGQIDGTGVTLSIPEVGGILGTTVHVNPDGSGSLTLSNGAGIAVSSSGQVSLKLPAGTPQILMGAVDILGKVLQGGKGAGVSGRDVLGIIGAAGVKYPMPNGVLDDIDVRIRSGGSFEIGIKQSNDQFFWIAVTMPIPARLLVDANRDGTIAAAETSTAAAPYRFWLNDDDDLHTSFQRADFTTTNVDGTGDLKDFFPVFLDIKQLLQALPTTAGYTYKLKQADGAVNFAYTSLTRTTAFAYKDSPYSYASATTYQVTATGTPLVSSFLDSIRDGDQGVLLMEGTAPTTQPLVLVIEKNGVAAAETSLPLSLGARILLLLHGMNSNAATWDAFVASKFGATFTSSTDIVDGDFRGGVPTQSSQGVRCYRLQFGSYDRASTRLGVEDIMSLTYDNGTYASDPRIRCGDFEDFATLGREVDDAVDAVLDRHANAQIVLVAHSRGGLAARVFLQGQSTRRNSIIGLLTTSSPHMGSRLGRIHKWLRDHPRYALDENGDLKNALDWGVADFLKSQLDLRRPVIGDMADDSQEIADLNADVSVTNLPAAIRYGEIVYKKAHLGVLITSPVRYSVLELAGVGAVLPKVSPAAREMILNGVAVDDPLVIGDGLIPGGRQVFTQLAGFPASPSGGGSNRLPRLIVDGVEVVHIEAPSRIAELTEHIIRLAPDWIP